MPKYEGKQNVSFLSIPKWVKSNEHNRRRRRERERKKERKSVLTMVSTNAWTNPLIILYNGAIWVKG